MKPAARWRYLDARALGHLPAARWNASISTARANPISWTTSRTLPTGSVRYRRSWHDGIEMNWGPELQPPPVPFPQYTTPGKMRPERRKGARDLIRINFWLKISAIAINGSTGQRSYGAANDRSFCPAAATSDFMTQQTAGNRANDGPTVATITAIAAIPVITAIAVATIPIGAAIAITAIAAIAITAAIFAITVTISGLLIVAAIIISADALRLARRRPWLKVLRLIRPKFPKSSSSLL